MKQLRRAIEVKLKGSHLYAKKVANNIDPTN
jgi:hypothetical protein